MNNEELNKIAERIYPNKEGDLSSLHAELQRGGFIRGFQYCKEQMMKEAVEGEIMTNGFYPYEPRIVAPYPNCPYDFGDKVRIIIVKED